MKCTAPRRVAPLKRGRAVRGAAFGRGREQDVEARQGLENENAACRGAACVHTPSVTRGSDERVPFHLAPAVI